MTSSTLNSGSTEGNDVFNTKFADSDISNAKNGFHFTPENPISRMTLDFGYFMYTIWVIIGMKVILVVSDIMVEKDYDLTSLQENTVTIIVGLWVE